MSMTSHAASHPGGCAPVRRDAIAACVLAIALSLAGAACAPDEPPAAVASAADSAPAATAGPEVALATPGAGTKPAADVAAGASRAGTDSPATTVPKVASARTASVSAGTVKLRATAPAPREPAPAARDAAAPAPDTAAAEPTPAAPQRDSLAVTQAEYNGWKNFAVNCTRCHGEDGIGSAIAPSLLKSLQESVTREVFVQTVTFGRPEKGMPPWRTLLSDAQIEQLYLYLKARSEGRLAPGRPHVKPAQE